MNSPDPPQPWVPSWTFGDRLRRVRRDLGYSQEAMADALGVLSGTYAAWEVGRNTPRGHDLDYLVQKIEIIFGVPVAWMRGAEDPTVEMDQVSPPTQPMSAVGAPSRQIRIHTQCSSA